MDQDKLPRLMPVAINGKAIMMPSDSLIASMANQLASRSVSATNMSYHGMFELYKFDIENFLTEFFKLDPEAVIDLFGTWSDQFFDWKMEQNKPFCKDLIVTFPDGSEWSVRLIDIAMAKAAMLVGEDETQDFYDARDKALEDEDALLEWASEYLTWSDLKDSAEEVRRPQPEIDYEAAWKESPKRVQPWDDGQVLIDVPDGFDEDDEN